MRGVVNVLKAWLNCFLVCFARDWPSTSLIKILDMPVHSYQVHQKIGRDKVNNARKARAKISGPRPLLVDHTHFGAIVQYHAH
jgi:hypothetical protein